MKKNTHYIFGKNFYSYGVEFWGVFFKLALADNLLPVHNIPCFGQYEIRHSNIDIEYRPLTPERMKDDICEPIYNRSIFTATTIRHFNFYMSEYFGVQNAYRKLKEYLKNH